MTNKLYLLVFMPLIIFSCEDHSNKDVFNKYSKNIKKGHVYVSAKDVSDSINILVKNDKVVNSREFLDSLIRQNKSNGFLYFERGYIKSQQMEFPEAILDYEMAQDLHYSKKKCQKMIFFCKKMMEPTP